MKKIILALISISLLLSACSNNADINPTQDAQGAETSDIVTTPKSTANENLPDAIDTSKSPFEEGYYDYSGTIDNKYKIMMSIYQLKDKIVGTYFYDSQRKEIVLDGEADETSIVLYEYDDAGKNTGIFKGNMNTTDKIEGTWTSADGKTSYPFSLSLSALLPYKEYGKRYATTLLSKTDKDVNEFVDNLQSYIKNDDKEKIAALVFYPIDTHIDGKLTTINNKEEFINNYSKIFYSEFKERMANAYTRYLFANWQGIMFGEGSYNIWINEVDSKLMIIGINN